MLAGEAAGFVEVADASVFLEQHDFFSPWLQQDFVPHSFLAAVGVAVLLVGFEAAGLVEGPWATAIEATNNKATAIDNNFFMMI